MSLWYDWVKVCELFVCWLIKEKTRQGGFLKETIFSFYCPLHIDYYPYAHYRRAPAVSLLADERRREGRLPAFSLPDPKTNNFFPVIGVRLDKDQDDIGGKKDENVVTKCNYQKKTKLGEFVSLVGWIVFDFPRLELFTSWWIIKDPQQAGKLRPMSQHHSQHSPVLVKLG